ncbi:hypothetical protein [Rhizobium sp. FY34]|uniref:hypothetical protein n=1 Tax=Rhizobium sp. FY34 TaxID=2562309 RepID=UPI0010C09040|nr:hypothetical protein [Rhizobium sp. FY34]
MTRLMAGLTILMMAATGALAQQGPNTRVDTNDGNKQRQRYICIVQAPPGARGKLASICRADAGRVGGSCRCPNVTGSGTLQLGR